MEPRVLLVSEKKSMLVNALAEGLQKEGLRVVISPTDFGKLPTVKNAPQIILFYMQNVTQEQPLKKRMEVLLGYMEGRRDQGERILFFVIGTADELSEALDICPEGSIKGMFARPFRTDDVAHAIYQGIEDRSDVRELKSIMIVDDDATMLRTLKENLSKDYKVYTAGSGMNAIQMLIKTKVDLILLDYEMPVVKGPQVMEMLKSDPTMKDIPVMFLTAKSDRQTVSEILSLKPESYLLKSLPQTAISQAIANFFAEE